MGLIKDGGCNNLTDIVKSHTLKTIREEFDEYILEDGNTLRLKDILISFGLGDKTKEEDGKMKVKTFVQYKLIIGVVPTADVDVSNLKLLDRPITDSDREKELKFTPKQVTLNLYETNEFLIFLRNKLNKVWTTSYKDKNDIPIYSVNADSTMDAQDKKNISPFKPESD